MKEMRVLIVSQIPPPFHGSTVMTETLIESLELRGVDVHLLDKRFSRTVAEVGSFSVRKITSWVGLLIRLVIEVIRRRPTHVIYFLTNRPGSFLVDASLYEVLRLTGIPVISYLHTVGFAELAMKSRIWERMVARTLRGAEHTVCLSKMLESDIGEWVSGKYVSSIPNTVRRIPEPSTRARGYPAKVLFLSNLLPEKGAEPFVKIAISALDSGLNVHFDVVGAESDPEYSLRLRKLVGESDHAAKIKLRGPASEEEKWAYLMAASLLVFPSVYAFEAQPLTIIEALAVGTPAIAFGIGGIPDLILDNKTGVIVKPGDQAGLLNRLRVLMSNEEQLAWMSAQATIDYQSRFAFELYSTAWMRLLSNVPHSA
jgi:glycosyltransferase involved in cell wall biosynthesis